MTHDAATDDLMSVRNIGPALAERLKGAGIETATALRDLGTDAAYRHLLRSGMRAHFITFYVLEMALQGRPWNDCKGSEKAALRERFDAVKAAEAASGNDPDVELLLDVIGTGRTR